jgi:5-(carboxyamino)imidazole ribonucleotide mutase
MKPISIIMGSESDYETVKEAVCVLEGFKVGFDLKILSAHRTPKELEKYVMSAIEAGTKVFIAAAGGAAALAGVIASYTSIPVIAIPIETKSLKGLDSLLSTVQMPAGVPVGVMSIGKAGAKNSAIFALEILGTHEKAISEKLSLYKKEMRDKIKTANNKFSPLCRKPR